MTNDPIGTAPRREEEVEERERRAGSSDEDAPEMPALDDEHDGGFGDGPL
jgi:hypothetical protein